MPSKKRTAPWLYPPVKALVRLVYPKIAVYGQENLPEEPCVVVGNHSQLHGPIACELYFPGERYTWCAGEMMHLKEVPAYAYRDFWSQKSALGRPFYKLLSYLIAPLSVCVFNNANTIGVYRDGRIVSTFKNTVKRLTEGANVVVFPEHDAPGTAIVSDFQENFVDVARLYHKKTGKALSFVPLYIAPNLKAMYLGKPIAFQPELPMEQQRQSICRALMEEITRMAQSLPVHTVVPYRNIPKRLYPKNREEERV